MVRGGLPSDALEFLDRGAIEAARASYPGELPAGAEFAVLPPQNASGNWVKVVQRVMVRVRIERRADDPPLRAGMSATVKIDTGERPLRERLFGAR